MTAVETNWRLPLSARRAGQRKRAVDAGGVPNGIQKTLDRQNLRIQRPESRLMHVPWNDNRTDSGFSLMIEAKVLSDTR
jgi:hypothetical protein